MPEVLARYPSRSNPSEEHEVRRGDDGVVYSTCRGWRMSNPEARGCTHTRQYNQTRAEELRRMRGILETVGGQPEPESVERVRPPEPQPMWREGEPIELRLPDWGTEVLRTPESPVEHVVPVTRRPTRRVTRARAVPRVRVDTSLPSGMSRYELLFKGKSQGTMIAESEEVVRSRLVSCKGTEQYITIRKVG